MLTNAQLHLAKVFLLIFLRDRQSILFSLFFPMIFMGAFSFSGGEPDPINLGLVNNSNSTASKNFSDLVIADPLFNVTKGEENELKEQLILGDQTAIIVIPKDFDSLEDSSVLRLLLDASQVRQQAVIKEVLNSSLLSIDQELRDFKPLFTLKIEDVKARPQRYIDFLLPGLLAFMLMNLCLAGSGFNVVEYRRRGILKRLFVTPILPKDFIISIVIARMAIILMQISVVLGLATLLLDINIVGNFLSLYGMIILGSFIFLCIGFCLGSVAKTQEAIRPIVGLITFPQLILSGVFFPISSMPELIQPLAHALPLSFIVTGLRDVANDGASLFALNSTTLGIGCWMILSFILATRYFVWKDVAN
ncbi:MAG TPA: ABC transporter permease [Gammaproteobacteria bacterium]|jgi:ABC-2 type transport system permease protein|nr:ABC transporter permease [Gammaproteobacteria bacterium]